MFIGRKLEGKRDGAAVVDGDSETFSTALGRKEEAETSRTGDARLEADGLASKLVSEPETRRAKRVAAEAGGSG
jgi:hypothetical protein